MKVSRLMSAIKKAGFTIEQTSDSHKVWVNGGVGTYGWFFIQGENAVCVATCEIGEKPDGMTDSFPQEYHDTIKSFIRYMNKQWSLKKDQQEYFQTLLKMGRTNVQAFEEAKAYEGFPKS